ncbi:uncharacterized protein LOC127585069 [Pristis pectinata]|uniref:uncharacterized protein LOC127585069 n=1 Tax=Pristis pectinata TaxID=685728 RepID=UPI00223D7670|nr:uncharacterized protein LOC127585069 [Pristis pectinata]
MSHQDDLREVTVTQTHNSWPPEQPQGSSQCNCQCQRRLLVAVLASVLLLFITIAGLLCAFCLFIYPKMSTETRVVKDKYAAQLLAQVDYNRNVTWFATTGLGSSYLGSGFDFKNQELHSTKDGMYYVYAKLKVTCSVLNQCNNSSAVKLELKHCTGNNDCSLLLNMEVKMLHEAEGAFDQSSTLVYMTAKSWLQAKIHGHEQNYVTLDDEHIYFGAFLIES